MLKYIGSHRPKDCHARSHWPAHRSYEYNLRCPNATAHSQAGTENELDSEESFEHISVLQEISQYVYKYPDDFSKICQTPAARVEGATAQN